MPFPVTWLSSGSNQGCAEREDKERAMEEPVLLTPVILTGDKSAHTHIYALTCKYTYKYTHVHTHTHTCTHMYTHALPPMVLSDFICISQILGDDIICTVSLKDCCALLGPLVKVNR